MCKDLVLANVAFYHTGMPFFEKRLFYKTENRYKNEPLFVSPLA